MTPVEARFWRKVRIGDDCWEWAGGRNRHGYGRFFIQGRGMLRAHRVAWELARGTLPRDTSRSSHGTLVCHRCDNRACVRPSHLFLGTNADNTRDMVSKGRDRQPVLHGERNGCAKLTERAVQDIRSRRKRGESLRQIARTHAVSFALIHQICRGRKWARGYTPAMDFGT